MRRTLVLVLATVLCASSAFAQRPTDVVHWSAKAPATSVRASGTVKVQLTAEIEAGWHLYALTQAPDGPPPLVIGVAKGQPFSVNVKDIDAPPPSVAADPNFNIETRFYEGKTALIVPLAAPRDAKPGKHSVPVEVTFQACSDRMCLRPFTQTLPVDVTVAAARRGRNGARARGWRDSSRNCSPRSE
jgi:DsbC/DsbD-like thiol-disulfide interchange protein